MDDGVEIRPILTAQSSGGWIDAFILFPQASSDIRTARLTAGYYYYSTEVEIKAFISPIKKEGTI